MGEFKVVWDSNFFGITVGELVAAAVVLFVFVLMRRFFARTVIAVLKRWASFTETDVDDKIVKALQQPLMFLFLIVGLSLAIKWIDFGSSIEEILRKAKKTRGKIEIEVETQNDAILCARLGVSIIMLDNFSPTQIKRTIKKLRGKVNE